MASQILRELFFRNQSTPSTPPSGYVGFYSKSDKFYRLTSAGVEYPAEPGMLFPFSYSGVVSTGAGTFRLYNDSGDTLVIRGVRASVGTAPTGASLIVDININGTTIFSTQGNRPTIAASSNTSGKVTNMNTTTIADGSYFTVDVDQVGSTVAGSNLTVQILC